MTFKITVEEEITAIQHRTVIIDADTEEEACEKAHAGEGLTVDAEIVDDHGPNGSSCEIIEVEYEEDYEE